MDVLVDADLAGSRLKRLLKTATCSRLHLAMVLVGRLKLPADQVLDLHWSQVDLDTHCLHMDDGQHALPVLVADLFGWHAARQRLDARRSLRWPGTGRVFVNQYGVPITSAQADAVVRHFCRQAELTPVPLAGLRHPIWVEA